MARAKKKVVNAASAEAFQTAGKTIIPIALEEEASQSYLEYSYSVIYDRALPDARDGMKPVHRRILFGMHQMGLRPDHGYMKCARVVGDVMGKFHPHGDSAIYEAMVRLAQDFSLNTPLVDGHGNFGSPNDGPAASRYCVTGDTMVRLADGRTVRMDSIVSSATPNSDHDISLEVLDKDGKPVHASKFFHSGVHPIRRMNLHGGMVLRGSENHLVLTLQNVMGVPMFQWLRLDEVRDGMYVVVAKNAWSEVTPTDEERQLGVLCGAWVSEGWATEKRAGFNNCDKVFFDEVADAYGALVGGNFYLASRNNTTSGRVVYEIDIQKFDAFDASPLGEMRGLRSAQKRIPQAVWNGTVGVKRAFLMALFEGDGSVRVNTSKDGQRSAAQIKYSSRSAALVRDIQELLLEFGVYSYRGKTTPQGEVALYIGGREDILAFHERVGFLTVKVGRLADAVTHACMVGDRNFGLSGDKVPFVSEYVRSEAPRGGRKWLDKHNFSNMARWARDREVIIGKIRDEEILATILPIMDSGYRFVKVDSVTSEPAEAVYSIRVDSDDHSFLAGGLVNHNTEARMDPLALYMVGELNEDTVNMVPNYDGSLTEPSVLPAAFPNLLVNGAEGIAVGMATKMISHNLGEAVAAARMLLAKPKATLDELMTVIPGPDLPTGGILIGMDGVREAYESGKGTVRIRAKVEIGPLEGSRGRQAITVTELPFAVGTEKVIEKIKTEINNKRITGISDIIDLTDGNGIRLVIECKTGVNPDALLNDLYRLTPLETSFGIANLALVNGEVKTLGLKELLEVFLAHRLDVVTRRTQFRLAKAEARKHIVEGMLIALDNVDAVVKIIRGSKDSQAARDALMTKFKLTEIQTGVILDMPLRRLVALEVETLRKELAELLKTIAGLTKILSSDRELKKVVDHEMADLVAKHPSPRRTFLQGGALAEHVIAAPAAGSGGAAAVQIADEPVELALTTGGLLVPVSALVGGKSKKADAVLSRVATTTRSQVLAVTSKGKAHRVEASGITGRVAVKDLIHLVGTERVIAVVPTTGVGIALGTKNGIVKVCKTDYPTRGDEFEVIKLDAGDEVVGATWVSEADSGMFTFVTSDASILTFGLDKVRPSGRASAGVAGIKLADGSTVVGFAVTDTDAMVVTTTGSSTKVTPLLAYPPKGRATGGVRCHKFAKGEDALKAAWVVVNPVGKDNAGNDIDLPAVNERRDGAGLVGTPPAIVGSQTGL